MHRGDVRYCKKRIPAVSSGEFSSLDSVSLGTLLGKMIFSHEGSGMEKSDGYQGTDKWTTSSYFSAMPIASERENFSLERAPAGRV